MASVRMTTSSSSPSTNDHTVKMPELLSRLVADCPRQRAFSVYDRCHSFDESDEELDARLREFRLGYGLTPSSTLHIVRVRFNDPEGSGK
jgi:hypothetical protein